MIFQCIHAPQPINSLFLHLLVTSDGVSASNAIGEIFRYVLWCWYVLYCCKYYRTAFTALVSLQYVWLLAPAEVKLGKELIMWSTCVLATPSCSFSIQGIFHVDRCHRWSNAHSYAVCHSTTSTFSNAAHKKCKVSPALWWIVGDSPAHCVGLKIMMILLQYLIIVQGSLINSMVRCY